MINCEDVKFEHPANWIIGAPSQSGKSYLVYQILKNSDILIKPSFKEIIYCYSEWQPLYENMITEIKNITFVKGLPELDTVENAFVILDDLMNDVIEDKRLLNLFTVGSHHRKISVIFLTQNIYEKGKYARSISLNAHYLIIFKNRRDEAQIAHLSRQIYPNDVKFFNEAYNAATETKFGYLIIDLKQRSNNLIRLRTIDFTNGNMYAFVKKKIVLFLIYLLTICDTR